jgi:hypothetical protein
LQRLRDLMQLQENSMVVEDVKTIFDLQSRRERLRQAGAEIETLRGLYANGAVEARRHFATAEADPLALQIFERGITERAEAQRSTRERVFAALAARQGAALAFLSAMESTWGSWTANKITGRIEFERRRRMKRSQRATEKYNRCDETLSAAMKEWAQLDAGPGPPADGTATSPPHAPPVPSHSYHAPACHFKFGEARRRARPVTSTRHRVAPRSAQLAHGSGAAPLSDSTGSSSQSTEHSHELLSPICPPVPAADRLGLATPICRRMSPPSPARPRVNVPRPARGNRLEFGHPNAALPIEGDVRAGIAIAIAWRSMASFEPVTAAPARYRARKNHELRGLCFSPARAAWIMRTISSVVDDLLVRKMGRQRLGITWSTQ